MTVMLKNDHSSKNKNNSTKNVLSIGRSLANNINNVQNMNLDNAFEMLNPPLRNKLNGNYANNYSLNRHGDHARYLAILSLRNILYNTATSSTTSFQATTATTTHATSACSIQIRAKIGQTIVVTSYLRPTFYINSQQHQQNQQQSQHQQTFATSFQSFNNSTAKGNSSSSDVLNTNNDLPSIDFLRSWLFTVAQNKFQSQTASTTKFSTFSNCFSTILLVDGNTNHLMNSCSGNKMTSQRKDQFKSRSHEINITLLPTAYRDNYNTYITNSNHNHNNHNNHYYNYYSYNNDDNNHAVNGKNNYKKFNIDMNSIKFGNNAQHQQHHHQQQQQRHQQHLPQHLPQQQPEQQLQHQLQSPEITTDWFLLIKLEVQTCCSNFLCPVGTKSKLASSFETQIT
ncbi:hypothetical protein HELRODRAFT_175107 [Helobdella robusta]|uniref:Uncharacterized protein n=1 Tax=Helobdella robusta TaxID=6412 RepID=T1F8V2_HELRO|nr:hypothetical protein HELRODRAFT_175107 [Helobdella robusta]ESO01080.1 hypothetical protein HELRODRAFT_175107 [Helobdella robusta]